MHKVCIFEKQTLKYMNKNIIVVALLISIFSCTEKKQSNKNITVSILPQKYFVEKICGNNFNINVLIPPGANPATCEMTSNQITNLLKSTIYFSIGYLPYETTHIKNVLEKNKDINHINLSDNIDLIKGKVKHGNHFHEGGVDPHIWTSCKNVKIMCNDILNTLIRFYPEHKLDFTKNYNNFVKEIDNIEEIAKKKLSGISNKNFIIYHPALTYFARENGLHQIPVEYEGKSPSPIYMKEIIKTALNTNTKLVLVQQQFDSEKAKFIAKEINGYVVEVNPLSNDWSAEMLRIIDIFRKN